MTSVLSPLEANETMSANGEQDQEDFNYTDEGLGVEHDDSLGAEPDVDGDADVDTDMHDTDMQPESNGKDADVGGDGDASTEAESGSAGVEDPVSV